MNSDHFTRQPAESKCYTSGIEDCAVEPPIQAKPSCCTTGCCCSCSYRVPGIRELWARDKRLLRSIILIVVMLNIPIGKYVLYPFMIFSTWIHESMHGMAALSIGGKIDWLNIYPDGSGLAYTIIPTGKFNRAWVASAGYQGTAIVGGIMLMFRRSNFCTRVGTGGLGLAILLSCILFVRNTFGLCMLISMGILLVLAGWCLPPFWVGELYALLASTCCLNAITSIRVLFYVSEATIGGTVHTSDATTMQSVTNVHAWVWASLWMALAFWMTCLGVCIAVEPKERDDPGALDEFRGEDHPLALSTEMA